MAQPKHDSLGILIQGDMNTWIPVRDEFVLKIHDVLRPECRGTLRFTPSSGPGWLIMICDSCGFRCES